MTVVVENIISLIYVVNMRIRKHGAYPLIISKKSSFLHIFACFLKMIVRIHHMLSHQNFVFSLNQHSNLIHVLFQNNLKYVSYDEFIHLININKHLNKSVNNSNN
jgi:hypothetical protein